MSSKVHPILVVGHALCTVLVIITGLPVSLGLIAERAFGAGIFDPTKGGDPSLMHWSDSTPFNQAALSASLVLGLGLLVQLLRNASSKRIHVYHTGIAIALCVAVFLMRRSPNLWAAVATTLLSLLFLGFWSRRLMDPDSR